MIEREGEPLHGRMIPPNMILARGERQPNSPIGSCLQKFACRCRYELGFPDSAALEAACYEKMKPSHGQITKGLPMRSLYEEAVQWVGWGGSSREVYLSWLWIVSLNVTCRQKFSQFGKQNFQDQELNRSSIWQRSLFTFLLLLLSST